MLADWKLVFHKDWNPRYSSTDQASGQFQEKFSESDQQQEWGIDIYLCSCRKEFLQFPFFLSKKICMLLSPLFLYVFKASLGVYMFLLQKINRVFEEVEILPQILLLWLKILSVPASTDLRWAKGLAKESLKKFTGFHLYPRQVCIICL